MAKRYDLVAIGTGAAALAAVDRFAAAGRSIAVIDGRPFGGTCALRGCDPKKVLIGAAEAVARARALHGNGIAERELRIDWPALMAFKRTFTDSVPAERERQLEGRGMDTFHGTARFVGPNAIAVGGSRLESKHVLIAAGAKPMKLGIPGEELLATSDEFLELERLPRRIALIGGGFIACELAHLARFAGADVTVLERSAQLLSSFDPDLVAQLVEKTRDLGVEVRAGTAVEKIDRRGKSFRVHATENGRELCFEVDLAVHAAGRVPALEALDLEAAGVAQRDGRLELNEFLQSVSNPAVYAAGDVAAMGPPLTPVSSYDGELAAANMLDGNRTRCDYGVVPSAVFTIPPLAAVGLRQQEAAERGLRCRINHQRTSSWYANRRLNEIGAFKVLLEEPSGRILGAHLLGPHADEVVNVFALAMRAQLTAAELKATLFTYPTGASMIAHML